MSRIPFNKINYQLGDLTDIYYDVPFSIILLIKAARIQFRDAENILHFFHQNRRKVDEKLKSATLKLIYMNDLLRNFTNLPYSSATLDGAVYRDFNIDLGEYEYLSDVDVLQELSNVFPFRADLSGKEMHVIEVIKADFRDGANVDVFGIFAVEFNTEHIRYLTQHKFSNVQRDHIVELQMINKICHECKYDVTNTVSFALHFNTPFNTQILDAKINKEKGAAVKNFLVNGRLNVFVREIVSKYWSRIRSKIVESLQEADEDECHAQAMERLDYLLRE